MRHYFIKAHHIYKLICKILRMRCHKPYTLKPLYLTSFYQYVPKVFAVFSPV